MDEAEFESWSLRAAAWGAEYRRGLADRPVRAQVAPGALLAALPAAPPESGEPMEAIFADFRRLIVPGMTHWQHPRFFAYFPANAAPASVVAEYLVAAMGAQCMLWQTSPAATELETRMMEWLRDSVGLPGGFAGVIQDSASTATLAAVLVMRERAGGWESNAAGLAGGRRLRIYTSGEAHSSVERAAWISGIGGDNLVRVPVGGERRGMDPAALASAIRSDRDAGLVPAGIVACCGGTSTGAMDDIAAVAAVARAEGIFLHVDAAWAGSAMICPENRHLWSGVESADSVVFNPHKWLGAQFDCSAHFLRDPAELVRTLAIRPEYLRTHGRDGVVDYSEWSVPLGRRFRALKLWFLLRFHGVGGLREILRNHVRWSQGLAARLAADPRIEIVTGPVLSLFTFRPRGAGDDAVLGMVEAINAEGRIYLTQTRVGGRLAIRFQSGSFAVTEADFALAEAAILDALAAVPPPQG